MKKKIVKSKLKSVHAELNQFCVFAKDHDCIEVTEWYNGEGFDLIVWGILGALGGVETINLPAYNVIHDGKEVIKMGWE